MRSMLVSGFAAFVALASITPVQAQQAGGSICRCVTNGGTSSLGTSNGNGFGNGGITISRGIPPSGTSSLGEHSGHGVVRR
jgi:hypothetical protein